VYYAVNQESKQMDKQHKRNPLVLTPKQARIFRSIKKLMNGGAPSLTEIATHAEANVAYVFDTVKKLAAAGLITYVPGRARSISLPKEKAA
jgi:DNA-binding MarR family transcriptional regulator